MKSIKIYYDFIYLYPSVLLFFICFVSLFTLGWFFFFPTIMFFSPYRLACLHPCFTILTFVHRIIECEIKSHLSSYNKEKSINMSLSFWINMWCELIFFLLLLLLFSLISTVIYTFQFSTFWNLLFLSVFSI